MGAMAGNVLVVLATMPALLGPRIDSLNRARYNVIKGTAAHCLHKQCDAQMRDPGEGERTTAAMKAVDGAFCSVI